jgi:phage FluMu gp28-like protein
VRTSNPTKEGYSMVDPEILTARKQREIKKVKKILVFPSIDVGKDKDISATGHGGP